LVARWGGEATQQLQAFASGLPANLQKLNSNFWMFRAIADVSVRALADKEQQLEADTKQHCARTIDVRACEH
jgi:hypothetical protein